MSANTLTLKGLFIFFIQTSFISGVFYAHPVTNVEGIHFEPESRLPLNKWTYVQVDSSRDSRALGLAMADLTNDGFADIVSGKYLYRNPAGHIKDTWPRITFPIPTGASTIDALLIVNVDDDQYGDVIAMDNNGRVFWLEADDIEATNWSYVQVGDVEESDHNMSSQGYVLAQLVVGGKPEIIINVGSGTYYFTIPASNPDASSWLRSTITTDNYPEGIGVGDVDKDGHIDISGTVDNKKIAWWKNPGNGADNWIKYEIGSVPSRYADRFYLFDLNGNSNLDIVLSAANGTANGIFWFEHPSDPASAVWPFHTVINYKRDNTMNSMDIADMDRDGDIDIISGEHRGLERITIWENNGSGRFTTQHISTGKESHLGARVADLDNDGDLDIVSIAWDDYQYLHLWRNDALTYPAMGSWWDDTFHYRFPIRVSAAGYERDNKPLEVYINFSKLLKQTGKTATFDEKSLRVLELNSASEVIDESVPFQFDKGVNYNAASNAEGKLVVMLKGKTSAHAIRTFHVYFDQLGNPHSKLSLSAQVLVTDNVEHEGQESYKIETKNATYYYHKLGAGFASMEDKDGIDWIGHHPEGGADGTYRGIPNMGFPEGYCHPSKTISNSRLINQGPIKVSIFSESNDKKWACIWDIFPRYARLTVLKTNHPFWFLYEGVPGGKLDVDLDFCVRQDGKRTLLNEKWDGDISVPGELGEWVYFGDGHSNRVLYFIHNEDDEENDTYWPLANKMTVFGFGRKDYFHLKGLEKYKKIMDSVPAHFTIGFCEDSTFAVTSRVIDSAYQPLNIDVGKIEAKVAY